MNPELLKKIRFSCIGFAAFVLLGFVAAVSAKPYFYEEDLSSGTLIYFNSGT